MLAVVIHHGIAGQSQRGVVVEGKACYKTIVVCKLRT